MARLIRIRKAVIAGGGIQVLLTIALSAAAAYLLTGNANRSVFFGFSNSLKQHCNCFKDACRKGETDSPHGRIMVGILIFRPFVLCLMLLIPALSGDAINMIDALDKDGRSGADYNNCAVKCKMDSPRITASGCTYKEP